MSRFTAKTSRLETARTRGVLDGDHRTFWLKDYLGPNGRYPYDDLPGDLDACYRAGEEVSVLNVARIDIVVMTAPSTRGYERPWSTVSGWNTIYHQTAWDALLHEHEGKRTPGKKAAS